MSLPSFVLDNSYEFDWPVKVPVPINGVQKSFGFKARFKHVDAERRMEILREFQRDAMARNKQLMADPDDSDVDYDDVDDLDPVNEKNSPTFEQSLLEEVFIGFSGINDINGEPIEFSEDSRDALLRNDFARNALLKHYMAALSGRVPEKNSSRQRKHGRAV